MSVPVVPPDFDERLADARKALLLRSVLGAGLSIAAFLLAGAALLVVTDYWFELPVSMRFSGLIALSAVAFWAAVRSRDHLREHLSHAALARHVEQRFPALGQAPRTHVQFVARSRDEIEQGGFDARLVDALTEETNRSTSLCDFVEHSPWRRLRAPLVACAIPIACLAWCALQGGEWWTATRRCLTLQGSYTDVTLAPGAQFVLDGRPLTVAATMSGRPVAAAEVQYRRRGSGDAWQRSAMNPVSQSLSDTPSTDTWSTEIKAVREPLEYRVVADDGVSRQMTVELRQWLKLESLEAQVRPPAFTGVAAFTSNDGDIQAPEGSDVAITIQVDRDVKRASLVHLNGDRETARVPLTIQGRTIHGTLVIAQPHAYFIDAYSADGSPLEEHRFNIDVQLNRPPTVALEEVAPILEVNSIAELSTRLKVHDEFGVSKYGLVYWVNDDEPKTLLLKDATAAAKPVRDASETASLLLETLSLDQHDTVTYFAFAEDNTPGTPQRAETDPYFLDIRPFRRIYLPGGQCNGGGRCLSLDELISRERSNFTRSFRAAALESGKAPTAAELSAVIRFELDTADMTRQFAKGAEVFLGEDVKYVYQAEAAMRRAATLLMQPNARSAKEEQNQAVHRLILARDTVMTALKRSSSSAGQFIKFDHRQRQKMRRPTDDDELIAEIVDQLRQLAATENSIQRRLAGRDKQAWDLAEKWNDRSPADEVLHQQESIAESADAMQEFGQSRDDLSSLARERLQAASTVARQAVEQLKKHDHDGAAETAADAANMFREAADQVEGQLARSLAQRLDAARSLSESLTRRLDELANLVPGGGASMQLPGKGKNAGQPPAQPSPGAQRNSGPQSRLAQTGGGALGSQASFQRAASRLNSSMQALDDLLKQLAQDRSTEAEAAAKALQELRNEGLSDQAQAALQHFSKQDADHNAKQMRSTARAAAASVRSISERLNRIRQNLVARQLDRVRAAEQRARALEQRLATANNPRAAEEWLSNVQRFSSELGELGEHDLAMKINEQLFQEQATATNKFVGYGAHPGLVGSALREVAASLQTRLRSESLSQLEAGGLEAVPAEYQAYVERYYQVLSQNAAP